jgi:deoxyribodipyrimidine photo-lyase
MPVSALRTRTLNTAPLRPERGYVLYWMTAARRASHNHALDVALEHCRALHKPLVVVEALRVGYRWASDRFHAFVIQGMADNQRAFADAGVAYHPYVEPSAGAGKGLIAALAADACVVVADDWPCFFLPKMVRAFAARADVRVVDVDSNGLLPIRAAGEQVFPTAYAFRRFLQKELPKHLADAPSSTPAWPTAKATSTTIASSVLSRWPAWADFSGSPTSLQALPIDHAVGPIDVAGGTAAARAQLTRFLDHRLKHYDEDRSTPDKDGASGLSPWLHWGQLSTWEIAQALWAREGWTPAKAASTTTGSREGWWGLSKSAEGFLDELVTWREIGFNMSSRRPDHDRWESLPSWAQETLVDHAGDPRPHLYTLEQLTQSQTHDPLWNAAQRQLVNDGIIQNYLRMLWGKKILEWSPSPQEALARVIELNNKYAIDGRDPNSWSGIFWVFGRYDRPWGPVRPIFGMIRYMTSENTAKKHDVKLYLARHGEADAASSKKSSKKAAASKKQAQLL